MKTRLMAAAAAAVLAIGGAGLWASVPHQVSAGQALARNDSVLPSQRPAYLADNSSVLPSQRPAYLA